MSEKPFFIGYLPVPKGLQIFLILIASALIGGMAGAGWVAGAGQDDPGTGAIRGDFGRQNVQGVIELVPYPVLHVTEGTDAVPEGTSLMMTAGGKSGVDDRAAPLEGQMAAASGVLIQRGDLQMLQLRGGRRGLEAGGGPGDVPEAEPLGRWRLAGEICDGKCVAGVMRPGQGLAHKACANMCLLGEVPPVFVSTQPVMGEEYLLITGPDGTRMPREAYDFIAQYVQVEGEITRHGDLLVFAIDANTLELTK